MAKNSTWTSLHTPNDEIEVDHREQVRLPTLDALVQEPIRLLKIDVQGHEIQLLGGARQVLTGPTRWFWRFCSNRSTRAALFADLDARLRAAGFVLAGMTEARRIGDRAVYADACYVRA